MASHRNVLNVSNGYYFRYKHALKGIDNCAFTWVEKDVTIRNLTLAESIAARNQQAKTREPLPYAEVAGLRYEPSASGIAATRRENSLLWAAHDFMRTSIA